MHKPVILFVYTDKQLFTTHKKRYLQFFGEFFLVCNRGLQSWKMQHKDETVLQCVAAPFVTMLIHCHYTKLYYSVTVSLHQITHSTMRMSHCTKLYYSVTASNCTVSLHQIIHSTMRMCHCTKLHNCAMQCHSTKLFSLYLQNDSLQTCSNLFDLS